MAEVGGVNILVDASTMQAVAQRLVCWNRAGTGKRQSVEYVTGGARPYFRITGDTCAGKPALVLTPDGATVACNASGVPVVLSPTPAEVSGIDPNACAELAVPTGLAVGTPAPTTTTIKVGWAAPVSYVPDGYVVNYRLSPSGPWQTIDVAAGVLTATATGLALNTAYNFRVAAKKNGKLSPATAPVTISTAAS